MNRMNTFRIGISILLFHILLQLPAFSQSLPLHLKNGSGTLRLGLIADGKSQWLDECNIQKKKNAYIIHPSITKSATLTIKVLPLHASEGVIIEIEGNGLSSDARLCWAFGACSEPGLQELRLADGEMNPTPDTSTARIDPEACRYNVHSDEGQNFTTYYGASLNLRVTMGVTPPNEGMRLADAYQQKSPLDLYSSGKKTKAPVLTACCPILSEKVYLCLYKQNANADYNYDMLPELFRKEEKR